MTINNSTSQKQLIPYGQVVARLNGNGFDQEALKFIRSYLCDRSQNVGSSFSKELDILYRVHEE